MCIGIPMRVIESGPGRARCEGLGQVREVDTLLVGDVSPGTWLLVFLESAREILSEIDAQRIGEAVRAVGQVMEGSITSADTAAIDGLFADLVDREPPKPASLLALEQSTANKGD